MVLRMCIFLGSKLSLRVRNLLLLGRILVVIGTQLLHQALLSIIKLVHIAIIFGDVWELPGLVGFGRGEG